MSRGIMSGILRLVSHEIDDRVPTTHLLMNATLCEESPSRFSSQVLALSHSHSQPDHWFDGLRHWCTLATALSGVTPYWACLVLKVARRRRVRSRSASLAPPRAVSSKVCELPV